MTGNRLLGILIVIAVVAIAVVSAFWFFPRISLSAGSGEFNLANLDLNPFDGSPLNLNAYSASNAQSSVYAGQGGSLGDISQFTVFATQNADNIGWYEHDEKDPHDWHETDGVYAPSVMYSDTAIPIEGVQDGNRPYNLRDVLRSDLTEFPDDVVVIVTGTHVLGDLGDGRTFDHQGYIGAYQARAAMKFDITDGSIKLVPAEYAAGEVCAMAQLSIVDYGPLSIRVVDVPQGYECTDAQRVEGLFRDPSRHGLTIQPTPGGIQLTAVPTAVNAPAQPAPANIAVGYTVQATTGLKIRSGAGASFADLGRLTQNVVARAVSGEWVRYDCPAGVTSPTGECWSSGRYLRVVQGAVVPTYTPIPQAQPQSVQSQPAQPQPQPQPAPTQQVVSARRDTSTHGVDANGDGYAGDVLFSGGEQVFGFRIVIGDRSWDNCSFAAAPGDGYVIDGVVADGAGSLPACA